MGPYSQISLLINVYESSIEDMKQIKPYSQEEDKKAQVKTMFDNISGNYDFLNRVFTFGMDIRWRKNVKKILSDRSPELVLDVATGTGDMPILYSKIDTQKIIGIDISTGMLSVAEEKIQKLNLSNLIEFQEGDAEDLAFDDDAFDAVSVTYGIRNFGDLNKGLSEILRVLKSKGMLVILETSVPSNFILRQGYLFYTKYVLPMWGGLFSKDKRAYSYLGESALHFPYGEKLKTILSEVGYSKVKVVPQTFGLSTIYIAEKG